MGPGIKNEDPPFGNFYIRTQGGWVLNYRGRTHPPGTTPKYQRLGGGPWLAKTRDHPLIISFQGPPPGTTPSKINKYHNFNKLQGQGPPPGTTPKISKIRGWSLTRKNERPPFDNFYIRDHPPGTTPPNIKDQGWSLARKNERPPPPDNFISGTTP